ncbi:hypothetical protein I4U23_002811 [Adineta vaga]|nr:hypothetical protein I4U23_002811 [Adineta vaga]
MIIRMVQHVLRISINHHIRKDENRSSNTIIQLRNVLSSVKISNHTDERIDSVTNCNDDKNNSNNNHFGFISAHYV